MIFEWFATSMLTRLRWWSEFGLNQSMLELFQAAAAQLLSSKTQAIET